MGVLRKDPTGIWGKVKCFCNYIRKSLSGNGGEGSHHWTFYAIKHRGSSVRDEMCITTALLGIVAATVHVYIQSKLTKPSERTRQCPCNLPWVPRILSVKPLRRLGINLAKIAFSIILTYFVLLWTAFSLMCIMLRPQSCCRRLRSWIEVAPYQPEQHIDERDYDDSSNTEGLRVLACSFSNSPDTPAFLAMLDGGGQVNDYLRLKYLLNRRNTNRPKEREDKVCGILCSSLPVKS